MRAVPCELFARGRDASENVGKVGNANIAFAGNVAGSQTSPWRPRYSLIDEKAAKEEGADRASSHAKGEVMLFRMLADRMEFRRETPIDGSALAPPRIVHLKDVSHFEIPAWERGGLNRQAVYAYGRGQREGTTWALRFEESIEREIADVLRAHEMFAPDRAIAAFDGPVSEHPRYSSAVMRHGEIGSQTWPEVGKE